MRTILIFSTPVERITLDEFIARGVPAHVQDAEDKVTQMEAADALAVAAEAVDAAGDAWSPAWFALRDALRAALRRYREARLLRSKEPVTHAEQSGTAKPSAPCAAWHTTFSGGCLNCGWEP